MLNGTLRHMTINQRKYRLFYCHHFASCGEMILVGHNFSYYTFIFAHSYKEVKMTTDDLTLRQNLTSVDVRF